MVLIKTLSNSLLGFNTWMVLCNICIFIVSVVKFRMHDDEKSIVGNILQCSKSSQPSLIFHEITCEVTSRNLLR